MCSHVSCHFVIYATAIFSNYSNTLELEHYSRRSPDYAWQLTLAAGAILVRLCVPVLERYMTCSKALNLPLGSFVHSRALTVCILYLYSALAPAGSQPSLMGLINLPIHYL